MESIPLLPTMILITVATTLVSLGNDGTVESTRKENA